MHRAVRRRPLQLVQVDKPIAAVRRLRRPRVVRQRVGNRRRIGQRIHQNILGAARMRRHTRDMHHPLVRRERLVDDFAHIAAIQRVRPIRLQQPEVDVANARADLLVGRKADPDFAVLDLGMAQQVVGHRHDDRHARLVVGAQDRAAGGRDDVVADLRAQVGAQFGHQYQQRILGEDDRVALVIAVHAWLDAVAGDACHRVHVRQVRHDRCLLASRWPESWRTETRSRSASRRPRRSRAVPPPAAAAAPSARACWAPSSRSHRSWCRSAHSAQGALPLRAPGLGQRERS